MEKISQLQQRVFGSKQVTRRISRKQFVAFHFCENLDPEYQIVWETDNDGTEALDSDRLIVFLDNRVRFLEVVQAAHKSFNRKVDVTRLTSSYLNVKLLLAKNYIRIGTVRNTD